MEPTHDAAVKLGKNQAGVYLKSCIIEIVSLKPKCVCKQTTDNFSVLIIMLALVMGQTMKDVCSFKARKGCLSSFTKC